MKLLYDTPPRAESDRIRGGRQLTLIAILAMLLPALMLSCGDDSSDPVGPVTPTDSGFTWTTAAPEDHGLDPDILDTLTAKISGHQLGGITSVLIVKDGYLVYEEYFRDVEQGDAVQIYSCTKSISAALIGIAIGEGAIGGVNDRLFDYMDGYDLFIPSNNDSLLREALTIKHLLTMTAGFKWEELDIRYGSLDNSYTQMTNSDDYVQFTLNQPITSEPGTHWEYSTGLSGLMAVIIENATGQRIDAYAKEKLFEPIGIQWSRWEFSPTGVPITGNRLWLTPRDMAKFGWLYSRHGVWDGDTIVPSSWVEESHQPHVDLGGGRAYGYQWWMATMTDHQGNPLYMPYALGYHGQHIIVPPVYDMVIVVTAEDQQVADNYIGDVLDLIGQAFTP
jgi:CubicO group peptidase (beta-lactamase class C family)